MCSTWSVVSVEIGSHNYRSSSSLGGDISISFAQRGPAATTLNGFAEALPASSVPGMCTSVSACSAIRWSKSTSCALRTTRSRKPGSAASMVGSTRRGNLIAILALRLSREVNETCGTWVLQ
ncbi:unnamed protein product [Musa acuminata var. zebrina]